MKEQVAEIVSAYVRKNRLDPAALPELIRSVSQSLAGLGQPSAEPPSLVPAVPIRRSAGAETVTCLECGWSGQMLKRHLTTAHSTNPGEYRTRWKLPSDYPLVAKNYAARRSELAKGFGFGKRPKSPRRK
jgi:predicted transcriptional regulator